MIFDLRSVIKELQINITGAIHVGGYDAQELPLYRSLGLFNSIVFEPQKRMYDLIKSKCIVNEKVYNVALGSEDFETEMFISDKEGVSQSSSILEPKVHLAEHPEVTFPSKEKITVKRFDKFVDDNKIDISKHNLLDIDVQGYELNVLKGSVKSLYRIKSIFIEISILKNLYDGSVIFEDLDQFLRKNNFVITQLGTDRENYTGNALYINKSFLNEK